MNTEVVILAQGTQKRLGAQHGPKQLLPLPACGDTPILARTVGQIWDLTQWWPTIVTWESTREKCQSLWLEGALAPAPAFVELEHPGNSSLKGIARFLELRYEHGVRMERTIVLLGDVVYSWRCLEAILDLAKAGWGFVGTQDLSGNSGELWGVAWHRAHEERMMADLRDALLRHPPFEDEYQPGQMRRWITGWQRGDLRDHVARLRHTGNYVDIDDYTSDVDLPHHITALPRVSASAAADDREHGILWTNKE